MLLSFIHNRQSLYVVDGPDLSTRLLQWWYGSYRQSSCAHSAITAPWVPLSLCSPAILILSASGLRTLCHYLFEPSARSPPHCSVLPTSHRHPGRAPKCDTHDSQQRGCVCGGGGCCTQQGLEARTVAGFTLYSVGYGAEESNPQSAPIITSLTHQVPATEIETDGALAANIDWKQWQEDDPVIGRVIRLKRAGQKPPSVDQEIPEVRALLREWARLKLCDGVLVRVRQANGQTVNQLVLPPQHCHSALYGLHDSMGHLGIDRTIDLARDRFYWPKMADDVQSWIANCKHCAASAGSNRRGEVAH